MKTKDYYFDLPPELIAQTPAEKRGGSRLLVYNRSTGEINHRMVNDLAEIIPPDSLLVFNNSRVRKARVFGNSDTGGTVEFLFIRKIAPDIWEVITSKGKKQKTGKTFTFPGNIRGEVISSTETGKNIKFDRPISEEFFLEHGTVPLPPYIKRNATEMDENRYQTVFSSETGSIAAPTAGLHFTGEILSSLKEKGCSAAYITLHVGIGTFLPIRTEKIEEHKMHEEEFTILEETAALVNSYKKRGNPVIAVGTTTVRTLESAWENGSLKHGRQKTDLFIYPGYQFKVVDSMITNFHTPESSLLVMVSAFAGKKNIEKSYYEAVKERYRFFSYGDVMYLI